MKKYIDIALLGIKNPRLVLRNLNLKNIRTLISAINKEDVNTISGNFKTIEQRKDAVVLDKQTKSWFSFGYKKAELIVIEKEDLYPFDLVYYTKQLKQKKLFVPETAYDYQHYKSIGYKHGLSPNLFFDPVHYVNQMQLDSSEVPFEHFLNSNKKFASPHPLFDMFHIYNRGVILEDEEMEQKGNIIERIIDYYQEERRHFESTSPLFAVQWYVENVPRKYKNPLVQFLSSDTENGHPLSFPKIYYDLVGRNRNYLSSIAGDLAKGKPRIENPKVSIVILNWNKSIMTLQCVATILRNTKLDSYEIVVVDNGSDPNDYFIIERYLRNSCTLVRNEKNRYYGEGNNLGVEHARGEYVMFFNNDAFPHENWLTPLVEMNETVENCGAVGSLLVFPDGTVQETGGIVHKEGYVLQLTKGQRVDSYELLRSLPTDYKSAAALMMERNFFIQLGGFDYLYEPAYFEDTDLCMKIKAAGKQVYGNMKSVVTHVENITSKSKGIGFRFMDKVSINRKKFAKRWDDFIISEGANIPVGREFDLNKIRVRNPSLLEINKTQTAIVYSPYELIPGGGERYILAMCKTLLLEDYCVVFVSQNEYSRMRLRNITEDLNLYDEVMEDLILTTIHDLEDFAEPDVFIFMGNSALPAFAKRARKCIYHCQFPFKENDANHYIDGIDYLKSFNQVIVNSEFTKSNLIEHYENLMDVQSPEINILYPPVYDPQLPEAFDEKEDIILSVGRFFVGGHKKNHDVLIEAFIEMYDEKRKGSLHLVGGTYVGEQHQKYIQKLIKMADGYPIYFHFDLSADKLQKLYRRAKIYWHATGYGQDPVYFPERMEHFGITVVESILYSCIPLAYDAGGVKESLAEFPELRYNDKQALIEKTLGIIDGSIKIDVGKLYKNAHNFTFNKFRPRLMDLINA